VVLPRVLPGVADRIVDLARNPGDVVPLLPAALRAGMTNDASGVEEERVAPSRGSAQRASSGRG
jgi:hypothetical protein